MMDLRTNIRSEFMKFLGDVYKERPLQIVSGKELMDALLIEEETLRFHLRFLFDLGYVELLSKNQDCRALVRMTEKGFSKFEN